MKTLLLALAVLTAAPAAAQQFDDHFDGRALRLDYVFAGDSASQAIYLEHSYVLPTWAGRRQRLSEQFLKGNGQIEVRAHATDSLLYVHSFSTLFLEWQVTEEAAKVSRAFENSFLLPFPKRPVDVTITLTDVHRRVTSSHTCTIDPADILIQPVADTGTPYKYLLQSGPVADCVDIAIMAEGYTEAEMDKFLSDAQRATDALFSHEPFLHMKDRFNVVAVCTPSRDSGPSIPHAQQWKTSAAHAHYDTFYSDRYLMTQDIHHVYDQLGTVPFEHIIVLVNSSTYGGGGIYNQITLSTSDHPTFKQVFVHEFGHAYGGLGDEYFYDDQYASQYPADTEPWEPNLTTLVDFQSKWADMLPKGTAVPTPPAAIPDYRRARTAKEWKQINAATQKVGVFEGGGYQSKGVYRPAQECRMKINEVEEFCPVCRRAIERITDFYTGK